MIVMKIYSRKTNQRQAQGYKFRQDEVNVIHLEQQFKKLSEYYYTTFATFDFEASE